ncbi:unnamed protein product [Polarella glacialis]|uniref:Uncharacterized protein n=1 Tax=Polarella glacialis TaxID=89957 RepID=A0A813H7N1_POLGL|nr:unnamed protein product [Polarella glacialis]
MAAFESLGPGSHDELLQADTRASDAVGHDGGDGNMNYTRRLTLCAGFLLVLLGCLAGLIFVFMPAAGDRISGGPTPAVGVAHTLACLEGVLLVAIAAVWHLLHLNDRNRYLACFLGIVHAYGNWFGCVIAAWKHASGASFDPSFTCSMLNEDYLPNLIVNVLLNLSLLVIPMLWVLLGGTVAKECEKCSQAVIEIVAWILIVVCLVATLR